VRRLMDAWRVLDSHVAVALIIGLGLLSWFGWHRDVLNQTNPMVTENKPGQTSVVVVKVPGSGQTSRQIVTSPTTETRKIVSEQPLRVDDKAKVVERAPEAVTITLRKVCGTPDVAGLPDPTCVRPLYPEITAVRSSAGYVVVQTPDEAMHTVVGPTEYKLTMPGGEWSRWTVRAGVGADAFGGYYGGQVEYSLGGPLFVQGQVGFPIGGGPVRGGVLTGVQFHF